MEAVFQPQIMIVEDSPIIAEALENQLNVVKRANGHCIIPGRLRSVNFEEFRRNIEKIPDDKLSLNSIIVDINLGYNRRTEGLEVLRLIDKKYPKLNNRIVYTGNGDHKEECEELGVSGESFKVKGVLEEDIEDIGKIIEGGFKQAYQQGELPKSEKLLVTKGNTDHNYTYTENYIADKDFIKLNKEERSLVFNFLVHEMNPDFNIFSMGDRNWFFQSPETSKSKNGVLLFKQEINQKTRVVEGIQLQLKGESIYLRLPDFETIEKSIPTIREYVDKYDHILSRFVEFFWVKRLSDLFGAVDDEKIIQKKKLDRKTEIIQLASQLRYQENKTAFIFGVWDYLGKLEEKDRKKQLPLLQSFCNWEFSELFYCEIEELNPPIASVSFKSAEDNDILFYRNFPLQTLQKYGLMHLHERFKFYSFSETEPFRETYTLLPLPPNVLV